MCLGCHWPPLARLWAPFGSHCGTLSSLWPSFGLIWPAFGVALALFGSLWDPFGPPWAPLGFPPSNLKLDVHRLRCLCTESSLLEHAAGAAGATGAPEVVPRTAALSPPPTRAGGQDDGSYTHSLKLGAPPNATAQYLLFENGHKSSHFPRSQSSWLRTLARPQYKTTEHCKPDADVQEPCTGNNQGSPS